jgi:hypothetical protein
VCEAGPSGLFGSFLLRVTPRRRPLLDRTRDALDVVREVLVVVDKVEAEGALRRAGLVRVGDHVRVDGLAARRPSAESLYREDPDHPVLDAVRLRRTPSPLQRALLAGGLLAVAASVAIGSTLAPPPHTGMPCARFLSMRVEGGDRLAVCVDEASRNEGLAVRTNRSGRKLSEGHFRAGQRDGLWREWYASGAPRSRGRFVAGLREGPWVVWHQSGVIASAGEFRGGLQEGIWENSPNPASPPSRVRFTAGFPALAGPPEEDDDGRSSHP